LDELKENLLGLRISAFDTVFSIIFSKILPNHKVVGYKIFSGKNPTATIVWDTFYNKQMTVGARYRLSNFEYPQRKNIESTDLYFGDMVPK
jgi:hypothetical protein